MSFASLCVLWELNLFETWPIVETTKSSTGTVLTPYKMIILRKMLHRYVFYDMSRHVNTRCLSGNLM